MATHDSIGDFLTILRNASSAGKEFCTAQWSKMREGIAVILKDEGYIGDFEVSGEKAEKVIKITMKYVSGTPALTGITRVSTPGCRMYYDCSILFCDEVLNPVGLNRVRNDKSTT